MSYNKLTVILDLEDDVADQETRLTAAEENNNNNNNNNLLPSRTKMSLNLSPLFVNINIVLID